VKSQDIVVLLKLASLELAEQRLRSQFQASVAEPYDWKGWEVLEDEHDSSMLPVTGPDALAERHSVRGISEALGISKSEVAASLRRSTDVGLARRDRESGLPRANGSALLGIVEHCLKYVFPTRPGPLGRGIATGFAAPVLSGDILSAGSSIYVWPYARGSRMGQTVAPLFKSVPQAVQRDPDLYAMLALVDALRLGNPRERAIARDRLARLLGVQ
jgi:hypothetical protein